MDERNDEWIQAQEFATGPDLGPDRFPEIYTFSSGFFYRFTLVAKEPAPPEIVYVPTNLRKRTDLIGVLASWNFLWEAAQYRKEVFNEDGFVDELPEALAWIRDLPKANIYLVADTRTKYDAYAPLYHLLPKRVLDRHGLPALKRGVWPLAGVLRVEEVLPSQFPHRLSRAFADHVWSFLDSGSGLRAFSATEPLVVLSHNLDYWLPYAVKVIEMRSRAFGRVEPETEEQRRILVEAQREAPPEVGFERPLRGGTIWMGEEDAAEAMREMVAVADRDGQLRGIIDAVRSNRVVDDFSPCWSFAREDFERKLYRKRAKVRVSFVELNDTIPVHGPCSEYTDRLVWEDFSALLNPRERHITVCLRNGTTKLKEIAKSLGYANHSPVSKALAEIRRKVIKFLSLD